MMVVYVKECIKNVDNKINFLVTNHLYLDSKTFKLEVFLLN